MALLRKDIQIGFLAGGALLAVGVGYALVVGLTGDPQAADASTGEAGPDPLGNLSAVVEAPLTDPNADPADSATTAGWDEYGAGAAGQGPVVTETPTGTTAGEPITGGSDEPPMAVQDYNAPENFGGLANDPLGANPASASGDPLAPATPTGPATPVDATVTLHTIVSGDSFSSIAEHYYGDESLRTVIQAANPEVRPDRLKLGQKLKIPSREVAFASRKGAAAPSTPGTPAAPAAGATPGTHTVGAGETLSKIAAARLGSSAKWQQLYDLNRDVIGDDPAALQVGMVLKLPT